MTTLAQVRAAALALPEAAEDTTAGTVSFVVRGRRFAVVTRDDVVQLRVGDDDVARLLADHPTARRWTRGDLPAAIGRPATRALAGAGITTLSDVARLTDADLLALHGVGPRAVRILREALAAG